MTTTIPVALLAAALLCRGADLGQLQQLYQGILHSADDASLPKPEALATQEMEESVKALTAEDAATLLRVADECVHSARARVRQAGLSLFFDTSLRMDSTKLLAPYIDEIGGLLKDPDEAYRRSAIFLLAQGIPSPSPKALGYLNAHMHAASTNAEEFGMIAGTLLQRQPANPATLREILVLVRTRDDPSITGGVINNLGNFQIATEEALAFIRANMKSSSSVVRREAIRTIGMLDQHIRATFTQELQRVGNDSQEAPDIRELARGVLARSGA